MTMQDLIETEAELMAAVTSAETPEALEQVRVGLLGRKGRVTDLMKSLGKMTPDERRTAGPLLHGLKDRISNAIAVRRVS